ncbi:MAG TPA: plasmid stabilization protein [Prolixibacteraceae bacterium]|nr:plasmid stabilization protein [Prolixibacteraceae bacterium]
MTSLKRKKFFNETIARGSFIRDIKKIKDTDTKVAILKSIEDVENAKSISDIPNIKSLTGYKGYYRIKPLPNKEYRIGLYFSDKMMEFVCCLKRKDIYKFFPKNYE